jgi:hypothetical protein
LTTVQVCSVCGEMFEGADASCRRCGADRGTSSVEREMRDMCPTYMGEEAGHDEVSREVRPIFEPQWDKPQWYEFEDGRPRRRWRRAQREEGRADGKTD